MKNEQSIAAVVVTYNRKQLLLECIDALLNQGVQLDIFIVDNASTDGTEKAVTAYLEKNRNLFYFNTGSNKGGAWGFNYGIRQAAEKDYTYIWIMDDDCIPCSGALKELLNAAEGLDDQFGFLASHVLWKDMKTCVMNVPRRTVFSKVRSFDQNLINIKMSSFVSLFIKGRTIKQYGLPIKEFFIWTDDWEFTRRILMHENCYLVNNSKVIHKSNSNIGADISSDSKERLERYYYLYRNDVYLYRREGLLGFLYELLRLGYHSAKIMLKAKDNKKARFMKIIKGTKAGLTFNPEIKYIGKSDSEEEKQ